MKERNRATMAETKQHNQHKSYVSLLIVCIFNFRLLRFRCAAAVPELAVGLVGILPLRLTRPSSVLKGSTCTLCTVCPASALRARLSLLALCALERNWLPAILWLRRLLRLPCTMAGVILLRVGTVNLGLLHTTGLRCRAGSSARLCLGEACLDTSLINWFNSSSVNKLSNPWFPSLQLYYYQNQHHL